MEEFFGDGWLLLVVGYPEVTDAGNGGPWEWRPLGMAALNRFFVYPAGMVLSLNNLITNINFLTL